MVPTFLALARRGLQLLPRVRFGLLLGLIANALNLRYVVKKLLFLIFHVIHIDLVALDGLLQILNAAFNLRVLVLKGRLRLVEAV